MIVDGLTVYAYVIHVANGLPLVGFDVRPIAEVEKAWLATWSRSSQLLAWRQAHEAKASLANQRAMQRFMTADESIEQPLGELESVPHVPFSPEIIFRLNRIPSRDGYGSVSYLVDGVVGFSYADYDDLSKLRVERGAR